MIHGYKILQDPPNIRRDNKSFANGQQIFDVYQLNL